MTAQQPVEEIIRLARRRWLKTQRIHLAELAEEAGISRATLFRWVGSKDLLLQEVLWSLYEPTFARAVYAATGQGAEHVINVHAQVVESLLKAEPLLQFIQQDPAYAMRILASDTNVLGQRIIDIATEHLSERVEQGKLVLPLSPRRFAAILTRINRSLMYSDYLYDVDQAVAESKIIMRLLLSNPDPESKG
jgi:AcrR family transcriptional regulator